MGVYTNFQNCTKSSLEVQYLAQGTWIVVLITFRAIFLAICPKITDFWIFSYSFLYKSAPNQKRDALGVSPKLPDPENLGKAFSHSFRSSTKGASDTYLFDIKVSRYRSYTSDRFLHTLYLPWISPFFIPHTFMAIYGAICVISTNS